MDLYAILDQLGVNRSYYVTGNYSTTLYPVYAITGRERPLPVYQPYVEGNEETGYSIQYVLSRVVLGICPPIGTLSTLDLSITPILTSTYSTPPFPQVLRTTRWLRSSHSQSPSPMSRRSAVYEPVVIGNGTQAYYVMYMARYSVRNLNRNPRNPVSGYGHGQVNPAAPAA